MSNILNKLHETGILDSFLHLGALMTPSLVQGLQELNISGRIVGCFIKTFLPVG